jgi:hypothetical protein
MAFEKFLKAIGIQSFGELQDVKAKDRAKMAEKRLTGEKDGEARTDLKESLRILNLPNHTAAMKLNLPETKNLKYKDGTAWLNLVLAAYEEDKSVISEVLDLPGDVRRILGQERAKRDQMPAAKRKIFDAAAYSIEQKGIFNVPPPVAANDNPAQEPKAADDNNLQKPIAANDNVRPNEQREAA